MTFVAQPAEPPILGPHRFLFRSARRRRRQRWVTVGIALGVVAAFCALGVLSMTLQLSRLGQGFSNLDHVFDQNGAGAAAVADGVAKDQGIPDGELTVAALNQERPGLAWVAGNVPLPTPGVASPTSVDGSGTHVVTAQRVSPIQGIPLPFCVLGLSVSSSTDPIVSQDHLPGTGSYWVTIGLPTRSCSADSSPNSGWKRANPEVVQALVEAHSAPSP